MSFTAPSIKETILATTTSIAATLGASEESVKYVKLRMGTLLDTVETRVTGVPQVKDVEQMWFDAFAFKVQHEELHRRMFAQEAIARGVEHMPGDRYKVETEKLNRLKEQQAAALAAYEAAVAKATEAQAKIEQAGKVKP